MDHRGGQRNSLGCKNMIMAQHFRHCRPEPNSNSTRQHQHPDRLITVASLSTASFQHDGCYHNQLLSPADGGTDDFIKCQVRITQVLSAVVISSRTAEMAEPIHTSAGIGLLLPSHLSAEALRVLSLADSSTDDDDELVADSTVGVNPGQDWQDLGASRSSPSFSSPAASPGPEVPLLQPPAATTGPELPPLHPPLHQEELQRSQG